MQSVEPKAPPAPTENTDAFAQRQFAKQDVDSLKPLALGRAELPDGSKVGAKYSWKKDPISRESISRDVAKLQGEEISSPGQQNLPIAKVPQPVEAYLRPVMDHENKEGPRVSRRCRETKEWSGSRETKPRTDWNWYTCLLLVAGERCKCFSFCKR